LAKRLTAAGVDRDVRGRDKASDHARAWIELAEPEKASPGRARRLKTENWVGRRGSPDCQR
jgi:exodeoxyribonuclease-3